MHRQRIIAGIAAVVAAGGAGLATAPAASANPSTPTLHVIKTISSDYIGPLQFAVADRHHILVSDSFTSTLNLIGRATPLATGPDPSTGGDIAGVAVRDHRAYAYTSSNGDHSRTTLTIVREGHPTVVANLAEFERKSNPDQYTHYGTTSTDPCVTSALTAAGIPVSYTGDLDSHPYAVTALPHGAWAVADAGGNDVLKVDKWGHVSLIAVLPAQELHVTAEFAAAQGLPSCVVGITYRFEPVPTDVETGRHDGLFVTTLPGGVGLAGSVYKIGWHHPTRMATGFQGATNLAIDGRGHIFVAELFGGVVSEVVDGAPVPVLDLPAVVGLEWAGGHLYASTAPAALLDNPDAGAPPPSGPPPHGTVVLLG